MSRYLAMLEKMRFQHAKAATDETDKNTFGSFVSSSVDMLKTHMPPEAPLHGFTLEDLEREAGEDWPEIRHRPEALAQFAMALREERQIATGIRPERWSETATCARCGPVHVPPFLAGQRMVGCRWCAPRLAGVAIPRPQGRAA